MPYHNGATSKILLAFSSSQSCIRFDSILYFALICPASRSIQSYVVFYVNFDLRAVFIALLHVCTFYLQLCESHAQQSRSSHAAFIKHKIFQAEYDFSKWQ